MALAGADLRAAANLAPLEDTPADPETLWVLSGLEPELDDQEFVNAFFGTCAVGAPVRIEIQQAAARGGSRRISPADTALPPLPAALEDEALMDMRRQQLSVVYMARFRSRAAGEEFEACFDGIAVGDASEITLNPLRAFRSAPQNGDFFKASATLALVTGLWTNLLGRVLGTVYLGANVFVLGAALVRHALEYGRSPNSAVASLCLVGMCTAVYFLLVTQVRLQHLRSAKIREYLTTTLHHDGRGDARVEQVKSLFRTTYIVAVVISLSMECWMEVGNVYPDSSVPLWLQIAAALGHIRSATVVAYNLVTTGYSTRLYEEYLRKLMEGVVGHKNETSGLPKAVVAWLLYMNLSKRAWTVYSQFWHTKIGVYIVMILVLHWPLFKMSGSSETTHVLLVYALMLVLLFGPLMLHRVHARWVTLFESFVRMRVFVSPALPMYRGLSLLGALPTYMPGMHFLGRQVDDSLLGGFAYGLAYVMGAVLLQRFF